MTTRKHAETLALKVHEGKWPTRYASCTTLAQRYRSTICATIRSCTTTYIV